MHIDAITLFPDMFGPLDVSLLGRAQAQGVFQFQAHQLRQWAIDSYGTVDTPPFGGGAGMVLRVEPFDRALRQLDPDHTARRILVTPQGKPFTQVDAARLSGEPRLIFLCGHYEGFDERIREHLVDEELSVGDFVLTGGEIPALAMIDATVRLLPGVVGKVASLEQESFSDGLLEYPHYTRPETYNDWTVPEILLSGHHANIATWRAQQALERTKRRRPDLLPSVR